MEKLQQLTAYLQLNQLDQIPALKIVQQKTKLKPSVVAVIFAAFLVLFSLLINVTPLVTAIGCTIIPAYFTFQVIGTKIQRQYIKYLVYWVCFGLIQALIEPVVQLVFGSLFLMLLQVGLTVALLHPKFNGALILYDRVIRVYVLREEGKKQQQLNQRNQQKKTDSKQTKGQNQAKTQSQQETSTNIPEQKIQ